MPETLVLWNDARAAFQTIVGGGGSGGSALPPLNTIIGGLGTPEMPPTSPSPDDDEFDGTSLSTDWNLHTTGLSVAPATWVRAAGGIDSAYSHNGQNVRWDIGNKNQPSALIWQPPANADVLAGISRRIKATGSPTNWTMNVGLSVSTNRINPVSPDYEGFIFLANAAPGNGLGNWDYQNFVAIYLQGDYTALVLRLVKVIGGVSTPLGTAYTIGDILTDPTRFIIKKAGNVYSLGIRSGGQKGIYLQSFDLTGDGLSPVMFGVAIQCLNEDPNNYIAMRYCRHEYGASTF